MTIIKEEIERGMRMTADEKKFGTGAWVYCKQHLRPHQTGWCTVSNDQKEKLAATDLHGAVDECKGRGFEIYRPM